MMKVGRRQGTVLKPFYQGKDLAVGHLLLQMKTPTTQCAVGVWEFCAKQNRREFRRFGSSKPILLHVPRQSLDYIAVDHDCRKEHQAYKSHLVDPLFNLLFDVPAQSALDSQHQHKSAIEDRNG